MADVAAPVAQQPAVAQPQPTVPAQPPTPPPAPSRLTLREQLMRDLTPEQPPPAVVTPTAPAVPAAAATPATPAAGAGQPTATPAPAASQIGTEEADDFQFSDDSSALAAEGGVTPALTEPAAPTPPAAPEPSVEEELSTQLNLTPEQREQHIAALLSTNRGRMMLQSMKIMREIAKPPEQGGVLGRMPSVEELRSFANSHSDQQAMITDFETAEPDRVAAWADFWFGARSDDGSLRPGALENASILPAILARTSPQLYEAVATPIFDDLLDGPKGLYAKAQAATGENRNLLLNAAQVVEFYVRGKARPLDEFGIPGGSADAAGGVDANGQPVATQPARPSIDPALAEERRRLAQEREALNRERAQNAEAWWNGFIQSVDSTTGAALTKYADEALQPLKAAGFSDRAYSVARADFIQSIQSAISRDPESQRQIDIHLSRARRAYTNPAIARQAHSGMVQFYVSRAKNVMLQSRASFLREMLGSLSRTAHATAAQLNGATGPNGRTPTPPGSGATAQTAHAPAQQKLTRDIAGGESQEAFLQRRILADLNGGA